MNTIAEAYVKLALAAGVHDGDYVDAYYGPPEWRTAAEAAKVPLADVRAQVQALVGEFAKVDTTGFDAMHGLRHAYLGKLLQALDARLGIVAGEKLPFDEETRLIYDTVAPTHPVSHYATVLAELDRALPGTGIVAQRYQAFRIQFIIPPDKLDAVFQAAIAAWLEKYTLAEPVRAQQRIRFIEKYRSYVINYNHGRKLVADHIEAKSGGDADRHWAEFSELISTPRLPSQLK